MRDVQQPRALWQRRQRAKLSSEVSVGSRVAQGAKAVSAQAALCFAGNHYYNSYCYYCMHV